MAGDSSRSFITIDPGGTIGIVVATLYPLVHVLDFIGEQYSFSTHRQWALYLRALIEKHKPIAVVAEDYRVFASKARQHIGKQLIEAEQLGVIEAVCGLYIPPYRAARVQPSDRMAWPEARLDHYLGDAWKALGRHSLSALQVALVFLEREELWPAT